MGQSSRRAALSAAWRLLQPALPEPEVHQPRCQPAGGRLGSSHGLRCRAGAVLQTLPRDLWVWDPGNYQPGAVLAGCALATRLVPAAEATDHLRFPPGAGPEQKLM